MNDFQRASNILCAGWGSVNSCKGNWGGFRGSVGRGETKPPFAAGLTFHNSVAIIRLTNQNVGTNIQISLRRRACRWRLTLTNMDIFGELHEQDANTAIGTWLNAQKPTWSVQSERRGVMRAGSGLRPDIVVREGERMPVIIETEYGGPAVGDARGRLGESLLDDARPFTEVIALGINRECQQLTPESLIEVLNDDEEVFTVQLVSLNTRYREGGGDCEEFHVWPSAPIPATPSDLIAYIEYAQVPQAVIEEKSLKIADTVRIAGETLRLSLGRHLYGDDGMAALRELLNCETDTAATRTACAIWLITFDLQNDLAQHSDRLGQMGLVHTNSISIITPRRILAQWEIIRSVNYLPVVELAIPTLEAMPPITSLLPDVLFELAKLTDELNTMRAKHIYNFAGELWQEVVVDREERAAHYTKPAVAELLATLGATRFSGRTAESLMSLDLMDAACGTGTLIGAGERAVRRLYRLAGGQEEGRLHKRAHGEPRNRYGRERHRRNAHREAANRPERGAGL